MQEIQHKLRKKRVLLEIASLDGAVIFDGASVLAFGSMIRTHPSIDNTLGARTTAALSAHKYGGYPIKISSDGDITIYFTSQDEAGNESHTELNFL